MGLVAEMRLEMRQVAEFRLVGADVKLLELMRGW